MAKAWRHYVITLASRRWKQVSFGLFFILIIENAVFVLLKITLGLRNQRISEEGFYPSRMACIIQLSPAILIFSFWKPSLTDFAKNWKFSSATVTHITNNSVPESKSNFHLQKTPTNFQWRIWTRIWKQLAFICADSQYISLCKSSHLSLCPYESIMPSYLWSR